MTDIVDRATRSRMMSGIRGKNTRPERLLRSALHRRGFRYRIHVTHLPGKPDMVLPRYRAIIMVHGCFWHRHDGCRLATTPASNRQFWQDKFEATIRRDREVRQRLEKAGWRIATVWECALKKDGAEAVADEVAHWLQSGLARLDLPMPDSMPKIGQG